MQFDFTPEQQELVALARRIAREQVARGAAIAEGTSQIQQNVIGGRSWKGISAGERKPVVVVRDRLGGHVRCGDVRHRHLP